MEMQIIVYVLAVIAFQAKLTMSLEFNYNPASFSLPNVNLTSPQNSKGEKNVVQEWLIAEKNLKKVMSTALKALLPHIIKSWSGLNLSSSCSRDMMKFLIALKQMKLWAFRMFDASGKLPNGLVGGNINSLGDYDGCINTKVPAKFKAQYCLVEGSPDLPPRRRFFSYDNEIPEFINATHPDSAFSDAMRKAMYFYHLNLRSSLCLPSTCTKEDVRKIAENVLDTLGIKPTISVPNCETKVTEVFFSTTEIFIIILLGVVVFLTLTATLTDVSLKLSSHQGNHQENLNIPVKCLLCFSIYSNGRRLLKKDDNPDSIKIFHGMKVITLLWVILNHTYYYLNYQALSSLLNAREIGREIAFQLVLNGFLNVETFFFISAVLIAYGVMKMKEKRVNVFLFIFRRIWRLTPPLMFVIAVVCVLPHLGSGPVWKETVTEGLAEKCKKNWWKNLLYFNNFIPKSDACIDWTWYLPVDTHLYFLSLLVIVPLKRNVRLAFIINFALLLVGILVSASSHVYYRLTPTAITVFIHPNDIDYFVENGYYRSYLHISSYSIGMTVGYILATRPKIQIPKVVNVIGWFAAFVLSLTVLYGVYDWNQGNIPGIFLSTLYNCTSKIVWSLALAWVTIACVTGNGGFATTILSWNAFVPLGRLTYMTYLVHPIVQFVNIGSTRTVIRAGHRTMIFMYCGNVLLGYSIACVFSLLFESPFMALEKILLSYMTKQRKETENKMQEKKSNGVESRLKIEYTVSDFIPKSNSNVSTINFKRHPNVY